MELKNLETFGSACWTIGITLIWIVFVAGVVLAMLCGMVMGMKDTYKYLRNKS